MGLVVPTCKAKTTLGLILGFHIVGKSDLDVPLNIVVSAFQDTPLGLFKNLGSPFGILMIGSPVLQLGISENFEGSYYIFGENSLGVPLGADENCDGSHDIFGKNDLAIVLLINGRSRNFVGRTVAKLRTVTGNIGRLLSMVGKIGSTNWRGTNCWRNHLDCPLDIKTDVVGIGSFTFAGGGVGDGEAVVTVVCCEAGDLEFVSKIMIKLEIKKYSTQRPIERGGKKRERTLVWQQEAINCC